MINLQTLLSITLVAFFWAAEPILWGPDEPGIAKLIYWKGEPYHRSLYADGERPAQLLDLPQKTLICICSFDKNSFMHGAFASCSKMHSIMHKHMRIRNINAMLYKCHSHSYYFSTLDDEKRAKICMMLEDGKEDMIKDTEDHQGSNSYWFYKFKEKKQRGVEIPREGRAFEKAKRGGSFLQELESIVRKEAEFSSQLDREFRFHREQPRDTESDALKLLIEFAVTPEERAQIIKLCVEKLAQR